MGAVAASRSSSSTVISPVVSAPLSVIGSMKSISATTALAAEQPEAVLEHVAALVVVEHARDRAALDGGQHQATPTAVSCRNIDADDIAVPDTAGGQHGGVSGLTVSLACL